MYLQTCILALTQTLGPVTQILQALSHYHDFHMILHFENLTQDHAHLYSVPFTFTINNYDLEIALVPRPEVKTCVHVIFLQNLTKLHKFSRIAGNVQSSDVLIFLTDRATFQQLDPKLLNLDKSGKVIVIDDDQIYTTCYYCGNMSGKLEVDNWLPNNFRDLRRHVMHVAYIDYFPFIYCTRKITRENRTICQEAVGSEYELLATLSRILNFRFELIEAPNEDYDRLLEDLKSGRYDFGVSGLSMTNERRKVLEFSYVLRFEEFSLMFLHEEPLVLDFKSFSPRLSILLQAVVVVTALFLFLLMKYCNNSEMPFLKIFLLLLCSTFEQPLKLAPKKVNLSVYVLLSTFFLFFLIVNSIYKSKLSTMIIVKPKYQASLENLAADGYAITLRSFLKIFLDKEEILVHRPSTLRICSICDLLDYIRNNKAVIVAEVDQMLYHAGVYCSNAKTEDLKRITTHVLSFTPHAWAFQSGTPFVDELNRQIKRIVSVGLLEIWEKRTLLERNMVSRAQEIVKNFKSRTIFWQIFVFYFSTLAFLVVCFGLEVCYFKRNKNRN